MSICDFCARFEGRKMGWQEYDLKTFTRSIFLLSIFLLSIFLPCRLQLSRLGYLTNATAAGFSD